MTCQPANRRIPWSHRRHCFAFNWPAALRAALVASAGITLVMLTVPRLLGCEQMDHGIVVGAILAPQGGPAAFLVRVAWHMVNAWVWTLGYAAILWLLQRQSAVWTGSLYGLALWFVGPMMVIPVLLDLVPEVRSGVLKNPGLFMLPLGMGLLPACVDLFAHQVHGVLSGWVYKHRKREGWSDSVRTLPSRA
jgi:hypothetical protein